MGAIDADFEWFKGIVYSHETTFRATQAQLGEEPFERLGMGSFAPSRVTEPMLQDVWDFIVDLGFRPRMHTQLSAGVPSADGVVYTLDVENVGVESAGLAAEDLTVTLAVPVGTTVVAATGAGYQGVRRDEQPAGVSWWPRRWSCDQRRRGRLGSPAHRAPGSSDVHPYTVAGRNCHEQPAGHHTLDEADGKDRSERFSEYWPRTARSTVSITGPASGPPTPKCPACFPALSEPV